MDPHPDQHGHAPAHGAVRLSERSAAGLRRRQSRFAAVPGKAGTGFGAARLNFVVFCLCTSSLKEVLLDWNNWLRQIHRWLSIAFSVAGIVNVLAVTRH